VAKARDQEQERTVMVVMKFGGTSVKDAEAIRRLAGIVAREAQLTAAPVVVVSAMSGVTDQLLAAVASAEAGDHAAAVAHVWTIRDRHRATAEALLPGDHSLEVLDDLERSWRDAAALLHAMSVLREVSPRSRDAVVSMGELASSRLVAAALPELGVPAVWVDARQVLVTDQTHGAAQPDLVATAERLRTLVAPPVLSGHAVVLGGFIGATKEGVTTTLGRGGSDYSASLFGAGLRASAIQIWTDVDGMLTADPRVVSGARPLPAISFAEASELAYFGAKVLHPSTIAPAVADGIPVRILNSHRPDVPGTTISASPELPEAPVTGIACKRDITVVDIRSTKMLAAYGFMRRVFEVFERHRTSVDVITTSEVSISITIDDRRRLDDIVTDLSEFAEVSVEHEMALLCAVGERLRLEPGLSARVLGALEPFPLRMVSQAGARRNLSVVLAQQHLPAAMSLLHDRFCLVPAVSGASA
jgi:aspartate kinase